MSNNHRYKTSFEIPKNASTSGHSLKNYDVTDLAVKLIIPLFFSGFNYSRDKK